VPSSQGTILRYRNFGYVGILTDNEHPTGTNRGVVDIDLNRETGAGTIRGTLEVRDKAMGDFDGRFDGEYERGLWRGRGWATGVGGHAGKLLKMDIEGLDPSTCPEHPDLGTAIDGARWEVVIVDSKS